MNQGFFNYRTTRSGTIDTHATFSSRAALNELNLLFVIQLDGKKFSASVNAPIVP